MNKDGKVVAILNERHVLVEILSPEVFGEGKRFTVFKEFPLPAAVARKLETPVVAIPKGELLFLLTQDNPRYAVLASTQVTRIEERRKPAGLGLGLAGLTDAIQAIQGITHEVEVPVGPTARLRKDQSLGLESSAVEEGDFVCAS